jgi:hypothetical protein
MSIGLENESVNCRVNGCAGRHEIDITTSPESNRVTLLGIERCGGGRYGGSQKRRVDGTAETRETNIPNITMNAGAER